MSGSESGQAQSANDSTIIEPLGPAAIVILNPHAANTLRRQDSTIVEAEAVSALAILHPREILEELRKDGQFRAVEEERRRSLSGQ